jgi:hypothetical protein
MELSAFVVVQSNGVFWQTLQMPNEPTQELIAADSSQSATDSPKIGGRSELEPAVERRREIGGPAGPEPTRYGDWERAGRCIDF